MQFLSDAKLAREPLVPEDAANKAYVDAAVAAGGGGGGGPDEVVVAGGTAPVAVGLDLWVDLDSEPVMLYSPLLVLSAGAPVPPGTPAGTVIVRRV